MIIIPLVRRCLYTVFIFLQKLFIHGWAFTFKYVTQPIIVPRNDIIWLVSHLFSSSLPFDYVFVDMSSENRNISSPEHRAQLKLGPNVCLHKIIRGGLIRVAGEWSPPGPVEKWDWLNIIENNIIVICMDIVQILEKCFKILV